MSIIIVPCMVLLAYQIMAFHKVRDSVLTVLLLIIMSITCLLIDNSPYVAKQKELLADYVNKNPSASFIIPRRLYFDYLFFSGFVPSANAKVFIKDGDVSDSLDRIKLTNPNFIRADIKYHACEGAYVVDDKQQISEALQSINTKTLIYSFKQDSRFYHQLIDEPFFTNLLSLVRDDKRMTRILRSREQGAYRIYKAEGPCSIKS